MGKVILITTRHIGTFASLLDLGKIQEIDSTNYRKVFFAVGKMSSAISLYLHNTKGFSSSNEWGGANNMRDNANQNYKVEEMFEALLGGNNIKLLKNDSSDCIEVVKKGVQRIEGTNIFFCHEWFASRITLPSNETLVDNTRKAYLKAIIDDVKHDIGSGDFEWVVLSHDKDFGLNGGKNITNIEEVKALGLPENSVVWTFQHKGSNRIYRQFINNSDTSKFDDLLSAPDSTKYLSDLVNDTLSKSTQTEAIVGVSMVDIFNIKELKEAGKDIDENTIVNDTINIQAAQENNPKPIIIYWPNTPLKAIADKRRNYLDSSIWIRYADSDESLQRVKAELESCCNLYATNNALEIREFKTRMAENSRLIELKSDDNTNTHAQNVVPFVFHSETEMQINTDDSKSGIKTKIFQLPNAEKLEWRILIVDDNAFVDDSTKTTSVHKCKIVSYILNRDFAIYCDNHCDSVRIKCNPSTNGLKCPLAINCNTPKNKNSFYPSLYIDCARSADEAKEKTKNRRYDIVLMDYLLGYNIVNTSNDKFQSIYHVSEDKKEVTDSNGKIWSRENVGAKVVKSGTDEGYINREYGTDILRELKIKYEDNVAKINLTTSQKDELEQYKQAKGPFGKFWIFFISAFSNAISEKMLSEGMHYNTDYWHIARGACPTTTPELFRYNLMSLMYHQLKCITEVDEWESEDNMFKEKQKVISLMDYLSYLFDDLGDVRIRAIDNFNSLLHLRSRYDRLKNDYYMGGKELGEIAKKNGSPLVQALFPDMNCYSNAFWEHTQHLIYLIAFGNILQWNEMWDEYIFIKENLKRAEKATNRQDGKLHEKIEKYIIGIKSVNFK